MKNPPFFPLLAALVLTEGVFAQGGNAEKTKELAAVLQSSAPLFDKARACQQLGEIGDKTAVPALARCLADEHLSAYARSGLEGIPDPSAAAALRTALGTLKGSLLAGVIDSLAALRDSQAVGALRPLAEDPASGVAQEALLALGRIDTPKSVAIIRRVLETGAEGARSAAAAACLIAAQEALAGGHAKAALKLDEAVRRAKVPGVYRAAATRGAILARQTGRVAFLMKQLRSDEPIIRNAALLTMREIPGSALAEAINVEIGNAAPELQAQLLSALADCHNDHSFDILAAQAAAQDPQIRLAALRSLSSIAGPAQAALLLKILKESRSADESDLAQSTLERLEGAAVDNAVLAALLAAPEERTRVQLITLLEVRGTTNAVAPLLRLAADTDETVSISAVRALGALADEGETPALMTLAKNCKSKPVRDAAEKAICRAAAHNGNTNATGEAVLAELAQTSDTAQKNSWERILVSLGYAKALPALEAAAKDANETIANETIDNLGYWPDPAPVEALLAVVNSGANPGSRQRALASVIQLTTVAADEHQCPDMVLAGWLGRASATAQTVAERRQIISVLGRLPRMESFRLLLPWLSQPDLQAEAGIAILQIAPALTGTEVRAELRQALQTIAATAKTQEAREKAATLAESLK
jgi:HEAT repeat protein